MFDIAIIGGGIIGGALVNALKDAPVNLVWLDQGALMDEPLVADGNLLSMLPRVSALTKASENLLQNLGVWSQLERKLAYRQMQVWDGLGTGEVNFNAEAVQQSNLGHIVENQAITNALLVNCRKQRNLTLMPFSQVQTLEKGEITLTSGEVINAKLIIGCDGAQSKVRAAMQMSYSERPYGHHAMVATIKTELAHQDCCYQNFTDLGPVAFLPLHDSNHVSLVYSAPLEHIDYLKSLSDDECLTHLQRISEGRLGKLEAVGKRLSFELVERKAGKYVQPGFALLGDAAHTIHPLAGQGANLGLLDVAALVEVLTYAFERQLDIADEALLRRYQRARQAHNLAMAQSMRGLKAAFSDQYPALTLLRNQAMKLLDGQRLLKKPMIEAAMGLTGPSYALTQA